jgi:lipopolysaccharide export system protein LptA
MAGYLFTQTRERPEEDLPFVATPADPEATMQSGAGVSIRDRAGETEFEMGWALTRNYPDGRVAWDKLTLKMQDGTTMSADLCESKGAVPTGEDMPSELLCRGNFRMVTAEGAEIQAAEATYNNESGVAILPGPVTFSRGEMAGGGQNGEYHRDTGVFRVAANARVTSVAGEEDGQVVATADSMTFNRVGMALLFEPNARIAHERQVMTADRATLYLADNQNQFRVIELRGKSTVIPVAGHEASVPDMRAQDIDLAFYEGTQALERGVLVGAATMILVDNNERRSIAANEISFSTGPDGRTLTRLDARDRVVVRTPPRPPAAARVITASTLVASGDDVKGLTAALFDGGVSFTETVPASPGKPASQRVGTSQRLTMKLGGQLDDVEEAQFQQNVKFRDGEVTGDADLGNYMAKQGQLVLRPARPAVRRPFVSSGSVTVDASELIDVDLNTQDLHARGDVKTVNAASPEAAKTRTTTGLFHDRETLYGFGTEFWYEQKAGRARYAGGEAAPARITQVASAGGRENNVVVGQEIILAETTGDLTATGAVESTMVTTVAGSPTKKPTRYRVSAGTLVYNDTARTATYTGTEVKLTGPDGVTTSRSMVMTLAAETRELERLDAQTDVRTMLSEGRDALADSLLYVAAENRYTLRGQPLVLRAPNDTPGSCSLTRGRVAYFTSGGDAPTFPDAENPGGVETRNVPCSGELQK